jgi:hypothetical protein
MDKEQRQSARRQMVLLMQAGQGWQEAARLSGVEAWPLYCLPLASSISGTRRSSLPGWQTWTSNQTSCTCTPGAGGDVS